MARSFDIPEIYQSSLIRHVKEARRTDDPLKRDLAPSLLDFGPVQFYLARHFGFCYGVENAIEIAYRALAENPDKRIFLLSEMIHNAHVNNDLRGHGIEFLRTTMGQQLIPFDTLTPDDIVIVPAFGTSTQIESELELLGLDLRTYDTTCPFVEKVWKRSAQIGAKKFCVIIHGKYKHEETRATFSHAALDAPVVVIRDIDEAGRLAQFISGNLSSDQFFDEFGHRCSAGFSPDEDLKRIGVVNQTTMLATETKAIAALLKSAMVDHYGEQSINDHFADTSDTLCYATNENQDAVYSLVSQKADAAIIVGGTNSSNTSHLVEICEEVLPTFFISGAHQIRDRSTIEHFDLRTKTIRQSTDWIARTGTMKILLAAGASCPDVLLEDVVLRIASLFPGSHSPENVRANMDAFAS